MAKGGGYKLPGLNKALKAVDALGASMTAESNADYAVALSALRAGQAGLSKQTRGLTRDLLAGQLKQTASLSKLAKTARAQKNVVADQQAKTTNRYGTALGQSIAQSYKPAAAVASGTAKVITGAAKAGRKTTGVAQTVAGIAQAGVAAQASAAKYSLNQALQQRAIIDNQTLASLSGQLYQTALQYNMQMSMYEKQRQDALKDAKKAAFQQTESTTQWLSTKGGEMGAWLQQADETNAYVDENGNFDVSAALAAYKEEYALDPQVNPNDANTIAIMSAALGKMKDGMDPGAAMTAAANEIYGGLPGWERVAPHLLGSIDSNITGLTELKALENLQSIEGVSISTGGTQAGGILGEMVSWLPGMDSQGTVDPTSTQFRDAGAAAIREKYGASTAKAWLRGQTNWSDDAIDWYLSNLPSDLAGNLQYTPGAAPTAGTSTPNPRGLGGGS